MKRVSSKKKSENVIQKSFIETALGLKSLFLGIIFLQMVSGKIKKC